MDFVIDAGRDATDGDLADATEAVVTVLDVWAEASLLFREFNGFRVTLLNDDGDVGSDMLPS